MVNFFFGLFVGVALLFSAFSNLDQKDLEIGLNKCQANGGLDRYAVRVFDDNKVYCKDGAVFTIKEEEK